MVSKMVVKKFFSSNSYFTVGFIDKTCIESQFSGIFGFKAMTQFAISKVDGHGLSNTARHACLAKKTKLSSY